MKESKTLDQIKLKVDLIGKIKKKEQININNILLNTEVNNINNKQIKLLLEIESLNCSNPSEKFLEELAFAIQEQKMGSSSESAEEIVFSLMSCKLRVIQLVKAIKSKKSNLSEIVEKILMRVERLEELKYIMNILFRISSIVALQKIDHIKLAQKYRSKRQLKGILQIVKLAKSSSLRNEEAYLFADGEQAEKFKSQNSQIISVLALFGAKERELMKKKQNTSSISEKQFHSLSNISKTKIKNYFEARYKMLINDANPEQTFRKLNQTLTEERVYLQAFPIAHLYFQDNLAVIESLSNAEYIKNLCTSESILFEKYQQLSANKSWSKSKIRPEKNPQSYKNYIAQSDQYARRICVPACKKGMIVRKHNYGNSSSSIKFIRGTEKGFEYYKSSALESGSKWKFSEILGVVFGRASARLMESGELASHCFSIILADRTIDFSVEHVIQQADMFRFMIGLNLLIKQYHEQEKEMLAGKKTRDAERVRYHQGKMQVMTRGRLLWSSLIQDLHSKNKSGQDGSEERYFKMEGFKSGLKNRSASQISKN